MPPPFIRRTIRPRPIRKGIGSAKSSRNILSQLPLVSSYSAQIGRQFHSFGEIHNGTPH